MRVKVQGVAKYMLTLKNYAMQRKPQGAAQYMLTLRNHAMQRRSQGIAEGHANTRQPHDAASVSRCS